MPKVLFAASTYSHIVNFHLPYLRRFQEAGWTVHAACGGQVMDIPYADQVIGLPFEKSVRSLGNLRAAQILRRRFQAQAEPYALVCTHTALASFFTRLALKGVKNRPVVVNMVHGYLFDKETPPLQRAMLLAAERLTASVTDLVLTMNQYDYEAAVRYRLGKRILPVPGVGVDFSRLDPASGVSRPAVRRKLGIPDDAFVLLYAAEFSPRKSQAVLIRAMERLPEGVILVLAGDGALRQKCMDLARSAGGSHRVLFPGHLSQMGSWYAAADAAVSASRSEGLPFHIMEAMYAGLPVIASDVKGNRDLILHGETGLLYPYGDISACAGQISRLLASESLRVKLADQARETVKAYDIERVLPKVFEAYTAAFHERAAVPDDSGG